MFDIGATELMIIAIIAILVVGPKELPRMFRTVGQFIGKARSMAREFQMHINDAAEEAGLDEVRKGISSVGNGSGPGDFSDAFKPLEDTARDIRSEIEKPVSSAGPRRHAGEDAAPMQTSAADETKDETAPPEETAASGSSSGDAAAKTGQPKAAST